MFSGSQLQVAKLAQMCPAVATGGQRHSAVPSGDSGQNPGPKPQAKTPGSNLGGLKRSMTECFVLFIDCINTLCAHLFTYQLQSAGLMNLE